MKLYHAWFSSASRRVRLCLSEKGLPYESVLMDLRRFQQHTPEYLALNPNGVVPTLQLDDGRVICESSFICEYLDDIAPQPPLRPEDHYQRAQMRNFVRYVDEKVLPFLAPVNWGIVIAPEVEHWTEEQLQDRLARIPIKERRAGWARAARKPFTEAEKAASLQALVAFVNELDGMLAHSKWLFGGQYSLAEIGCVPIMARLHDISPESIQAVPRVAAWWQAVRDRPSYKQARIANFADEVALADADLAEEKLARHAA